MDQTVGLGYNDLRTALKNAHDSQGVSVNIRMVDVSSEQQADGSSCGLYAVENAAR